MNGILLIDKEQDWTSNDVVAKLKGILHERRIGHSRTLEPMATGVLAVFLGRGTRAVELCENDEKEYLAGLRLGLSTDTQDTTGQTLETRPVTVTRSDVEAALGHFRGTIQQIPPMYSAVKINGQKLYELARRGREVERKPREITIYELELLAETSPGEYRLRCLCSKGTYIRTLCHDLGEILGCGGAMSSLRRTMAGGFRLEDAVTLEDVQSQGESLLLPTDRLFADSPAYTVPSAGREKRIRNGNPITDEPLPDGTYRVYGQNGDFLCLSRAQGGVLTAIKNFFGG